MKLITQPIKSLIFIAAFFAVLCTNANAGDRSYLGFNGGWEKISGVSTYGAGMFFGVNFGKMRTFGLETYIDCRNWSALNEVSYTAYSVHAGAKFNIKFMRVLFLKAGGGVYLGVNNLGGTRHTQNDYELNASTGLKVRFAKKFYLYGEFGGRYFLKPIMSELQPVGSDWYSMYAGGGFIFHF